MGIKKKIVFLGLALVFALAPRLSGAAEVELEEDFPSKYAEVLKSLPGPTPLNGGRSDDLEAVFPSFSFPFSVFNLEINEPTKKIFSPGEKISLKTSLNYSYKGEDNLKKIEETCLKENNPEVCKTLKSYKVSEFNKLGLYVQVWRKDPSPENSKKGDYLITEFYSFNNASLAEGEKFESRLNWEIPKEIQSGEYYFLFFLNQADGFALLGNPLVTYSEAKRLDFQIENAGSGNGLEFDKNNIKVANQDYAYRRPAITIELSNPIVEIPLKNLDGTDKNVTIKYEAYRWGRTDNINLVDSKTENKIIKGNAANSIKYVLPTNPNESVYDIRISAETDDSITTSNVRLVLKDRERGIFTFLSFVDKGDSRTPMFCARNASWEGKFQGKIKLIMGNEEFEQIGSIDADSGTCFVLKNKLKAEKNSCAKVRGEIYNKEGLLVDSREAEAECSDSKNVTAEKASSSKINLARDDSFNYVFYGIIILFTLLLLGVVIIKIKDKK